MNFCLCAVPHSLNCDYLLSKIPGESQNVESEEEEQEVPMVMVAGQPVPYDEVDEEMTQKMTPAERDAYIKIGQEMYENMYD